MAASTVAATRRYRLSIPLPMRYRTPPHWSRSGPGTRRKPIRPFPRPVARQFAGSLPLQKNYTRGPHFVPPALLYFLRNGSFCARERMHAPDIDGRTGKCTGNRNSHPIVLHAEIICVSISMSLKIVENICKNASIIFFNPMIFIYLFNICVSLRVYKKISARFIE